MIFIKNIEQLDQLIKNGIRYAELSTCLDAEHQAFIFALYRKYFEKNGFPKVKTGTKGKSQISDAMNKEQAENIREFIKGELKNMVTFNKAEAQKSGALPEIKQEVLVTDATFGQAKSGKPMLTVKLQGLQGGFGTIFLVDSDYIDNKITGLLSSADSLGINIPENYDFQLNDQLAGFIKQYVPRLYVNVKEKDGFTNVNPIRKPQPKVATAGGGVPDPFAQQDQQTAPAQSNPFARTEQPQAQNTAPNSNQLPPTFGQDAGGFPPQDIDPNSLPFDMTGFGQ